MIDNASKIKQAFEEPQWYLQKTAFNIAIRVETVREYITGPHESILDIGCGDGSLSAGLINGQNRLTLVDQSQTMLGIARARIPEALLSRVQTINASFMDAPLEAQSFDLILCVGVLAYVERRRDFIAKIKSLLRPGGSLIIECTDSRHFVSHLVVAYSKFRNWMNPGRMRTVLGSSADLLAICRDLGFELCGSFRYSMQMPIVSKIMSGKVTYKSVRYIFGTAAHNRNSSLGNECIYHFKHPGESASAAGKAGLIH
jgi:ubiquinone/menaquinone biosynthesis C-methylase UbiE